MEYLISFIEGMITFISPCLLPMLPVYISYFAGGKERTVKKTVACAFGFVLGFTLIFTLMGALAGSLGSFLREYSTALNIVTGAIVILFGLSYLGLFNISLFKGPGISIDTGNLGIFSSVLFGMVFSVGWTPCVGAFLGSALMLASQQGSLVTGVVMLLCYSLGLGIPFILSAVLVDTLKGAFGFIKSNYKTINAVCGAFLVLVGIAMMTGMMNKLLALLSFRRY